MKIEIKGADEYAKKLSLVGNKSTAIAKQALYPGAKVLADGIKGQLQELPASDNFGNIIAWNAKRNAKLSAEQKEGLVSGFGLSKMKYENGQIYLVAGFKGYNSVVTKKWPKGQPNLMIAAVVEKGTSFFTAQPFFKRATIQSKSSVTGAMQSELERAVSEIVK